MRARWSDLLFLALVAGVGSLWYFGRNQPIVVVERTPVVSCPDCRGQGSLKCPKCGEFGSVETFMRCPECGGTGKHRWRLCSSLGAPCRCCRGSGTVESRCACSYCNSTGKAKCLRCSGTGRVPSAALRIRTVKAELSLWERVLALLRLGPDPNPRPYCDKAGVCPLIRRYIDVKAGPETAVLEWGRFHGDGAEWKMTTLIERADTMGRKSRRYVEFVVRGREVAGSRLASAGN